MPCLTVLTNFIGVGQMDAFELIKMFAALMLSQTHYWLDGWLSTSLQCVTNVQNRQSATCGGQPTICWADSSPDTHEKYSHIKVQTKKRLSENKIQSTWSKHATVQIAKLRQKILLNLISDQLFLKYCKWHYWTQKSTLMDTLQLDNNYKCVLWWADNKLFHQLY